MKMPPRIPAKQFRAGEARNDLRYGNRRAVDQAFFSQASLRNRANFDTLPSMITPQKKLIARFYQSESGRKPVREWLLGLTEEDRRMVGKDIQKVEFGWPIGMPYCRLLGHSLWEVRSNLADGRIGRVIFCIMAGEMVLLNGFVKKTQKTPPQEIDLALKRRKELE
jgi:phage-related protein